MAARVPANRKSAAEKTAPSGFIEMAWCMASVVRMSEIMHVFQISPKWHKTLFLSA
jgi:hypothetical protein